LLQPRSCLRCPTLRVGNVRKPTHRAGTGPTPKNGDYMRSERIRRFLWRDIPLGLLLVAVVLVAIYLILQMGFDAPIRATLMFMVYMALVILICMFFVFHKRYRRLCLEDSGASHSDIGSTGLDYLNGRTIGKVVFWCVAIGVVLPVLQFTIYTFCCCRLYLSMPCWVDFRRVGGGLLPS
jgi:hypothetical protein